MASLQEALTVALDLHQAGEAANAETLYRRILDAAPETAAAAHYLGLLLGQTGRLVACAHALRRAVALSPQQGDSYRQLAKASMGLGDRGGAFSAWGGLARLAPNDGEAAHGAGVAASAVGDASASRRWLTRAAALKPEEYFGDLRALAELLIDKADWAAASNVVQSLLILRPDDREAWVWAGGVADRRKNLPAALPPFRRAIALDPTDAECWANLSRLRLLERRPALAWPALQRAAALAPSDPGVLHDLCALTFAAGVMEKAAAWSYRQDSTDERVKRTRRAIGLYRNNDDGRRMGVAQTRRAKSNGGPLRPSPPRDAARPLRVGYVSADLWGGHPVIRNLLPVLRRCDSADTALYFYVEPPGEDATTAELQAMAAAWRDIRRLDDAQVADVIKADDLDVLVFLAASFEGNRLALAARRIAPVQISFHDVATSQSSEMDFIITDRVMTPRFGREFLTERPLRLPHFYIADLPAPAPPVNPCPALANGYVTFGCFNNPAKLSDETLDVWGQLLARLPNARLHLRYFNWFDAPICADRVRARLADHGVAAERIYFPANAGVDRNDHLKLYHAVDIALDPFPFSGSTTSFEALCMGAPVVTWAQDRMVSRWTASMLDALGLNKLVACSPDAYVAAAAALAENVDELAALRAGLRDRVAASPLTDARRKARELSRLYRAASAFLAKSK